MGNTNSKPDSNGGNSTAPDQMDLYAVLGIEPTATDGEIRTAFRRLALLHHPDKNIGNEQQAADAFTRIKHAYTVLLDPDERAWYDKHRKGAHREAQRKSKGPRVRKLDPEDLTQFFSPTFYSDGMTDLPKGFFNVYRQLFDYLEQMEEYEDPEGQKCPVSFGSNSTPYDTSIKTFYAYWFSFSTTRRDFDLGTNYDDLDSYDFRQQYNRRDRRYFEKEREKKLEAARREYNDQVKSLASFVQKRDPRYKQWMAEKKEEAERKAKAKKLASSLGTGQAYKEQAWSRIEQEDEEWLREQLTKLDLHSTSDTGDSEQDAPKEFYCIACKKTFKSHKQWKNHEQSKKHVAEMSKYAQTDSQEQEEQEKDTETEGERESELTGLVQETGVETECNGADDSEAEPPAAVRAQDEQDADAPEESAPSTLPNYEDSKQKPPKRKDRKSKPNTPTPSISVEKQPSKKKQDKAKAPPVLKCNTCKQVFDSRNKLFTHLKETGHAHA